MRRAAKVDRNHKEIVAAFRACGCSVVSLAALGRGVPDLLVARGRWMALVEVKAPGGRLTPDQEAFMAVWRGPKVQIVRTVDDVLELLS